MKPDSILVFISIMGSYLLMFGVSNYANKRNSFKLFSHSGWAKEIPTLFLTVISGIIFFGIVPFWIKGYQKSLDIIFGQDFPFLQNLAIISVSVFLAFKIGYRQSKMFFLNLPVSFFRQEKPEEYYIYGYLYYRTLYILAYEFWFRGILLFTLLHHFQLIPAIILNVILYGLMHYFLDKREFWLCIPFGAYLCFLCWWIGGAWPAMLIHLSLSLSYEMNFVFINKFKFLKIWKS